MLFRSQKRVFGMLPGLQHAVFVRLGSLHRNTFIDAPKFLDPSLQLRSREGLFFAGQITGVEGYVESTASGLLAGINAARLFGGMPPLVPPRTTALGSILSYITDPGREDFQPMNANYGLFPLLPGTERPKPKERKLKLAERALRDMADWSRCAVAQAEEKPRFENRFH